MHDVESVLLTLVLGVEPLQVVPLLQVLCVPVTVVPERVYAVEHDAPQLVPVWHTPPYLVTTEYASPVHVDVRNDTVVA